MHRLITTWNVVQSITMKTKIGEGNWVRTGAISVPIWTNPRKRFVRWETPVLSRITQWKNFIIHRCTKLSFVRVILMDQEFANMGTIVRLHTLNQRYRLTLSSGIIGMRTSTCFTLRQLGARTKRKTISEKFVFMRITGKILDASRIFIHTWLINVERGILKNRL